MRGEVLISVNIPISHFPLSLTHSAMLDKFKTTVCQMLAHLDIHDAWPCHPHGGILNHHELAVFLGARPIEAWYERLKLRETRIRALCDRPVELDLSLSPRPGLHKMYKFKKNTLRM